jgi:hypothetical protein
MPWARLAELGHFRMCSASRGPNALDFAGVLASPWITLLSASG